MSIFPDVKVQPWARVSQALRCLIMLKITRSFQEYLYARRVRGKEGKSLKVECEFIAFGLPIDLIFIPIDIPFQ